VASIYDSPGQQVALTGSQTNPSFQPVEAYDPSRQILQQSERDLQAFAQFSETLGGFLKQKAEEKKKAKIAAGYGKFIRGEIVLDPKTKDKFIAQAAMLEAEATKDIAVAKQVAASGKDPGAASTILATSPAVSGWEAVGAAQAAAQLAPANLESFLYSKKRSDVPVVLPDGSLVKPSEAKGYQISDVTRVLTQQWVQEYGLDRINPQIIQEFGGYNMAMAEREVMRSWMKETDERELKTKQYEVTIKNANTIPSALTPIGANQWQATSWNDLMRVYGDPVVANETQLQIIGDQLKVYASTGDTTSMRLLINNLSAAPIPGTNMTFGSKNAAKFREFETQFTEATKAAAQRIEDDDRAGLDTAYQQFQSRRKTDTPEQLAIARSKFREFLAKSSSPYAMELQNKLSSEDSSSRLAENIEKQIQAGNKKPGGGFLWTEDEIDKLVLSNDLEEAEATRIKAMLPDIPSLESLGKGIGSQMVIPTVRGQLLGRLAQGGATYAADAGFRARIDGAINGASRVAFDTLSKKWQAEFDRTGKYPNDSVVAQQWIAETERNLRLTNEPYYINPKGETPNVLKPLPAGQPYEIKNPVANPEELRRIRQQVGPLPTIPATVQRIKDPSDFQFYQDIIDKGGVLPEEIKAAAEMAGLSVDGWMAAQGRLLGTPYKPNVDSQASFQKNAAINLNAANILRNPRSTNAQRRSALKILEAGVTPTAISQGDTMGAGDFGGLAKLTSSGEGGFDSVNRGTAGDTPSGMKLTSMRIGDVQQLQQRYNVTKGKEGVFAVGFAQWVSTGQLDMAVKAAGLSPDDKMTPENQLKMFWAYILNTNKRPALRDYLLGKNNNLDAAQEDFAFEWAAAPGVDGRGKYDGDKAGNRASISSIKLRQSLLNARRELKQMADSGMDPIAILSR
jgi:hypothetical protein